MRRFRAWSAALLGIVLVIAFSSVGCRLVKRTAELPVRAVGSVTWNKGATNAAPPIELEQSLLRVSDELSSRVTTATDSLEQDGEPIDPADVLRWKIAFSTEIASIATGGNAVAGVLDMAVFTTITRLSWEEHWKPKVFGAVRGRRDRCFSHGRN